jgi:hypothetical protein
MITQRRLSILTGLLLLLFGQHPPQAGVDAGIPSVDEIVRKANHAAYYQGQDGRSHVAMTITDRQGRIRQRRFTILRRNALMPAANGDGEQQFYVYFHHPPDVSKMVFMVWKHLDGDDDRWLYLPALDLVKRIAASDERTAFVGSNFFYEDVSGRGVNEDTHELVEASANYYVLKNTPKEPGRVEFASYTVWVHRQTFLTVKTEYYDAQGKKYREYQALEVKTIQDHPTVVKARMDDQRTGGHTVVEYTEVRYGIGLPEDIFTERYLRRAPGEFLGERIQ